MTILVAAEDSSVDLDRVALERAVQEEQCPDLSRFNPRRARLMFRRGFRSFDRAC